MTTGMRAPPTIDMMRNDEARLVRGPRPWTASAKMVGNMIDMKKKSARSAWSETPGIAATTTRQRATLMAAYSVRSLRGAIQVMRSVPTNRPAMKSMKPYEKIDDATLTTARASAI